jgi:HEAT repeat protein
VPTLIASLKSNDADISWSVARVLAEIGAPAVPSLTAVLMDKDLTARRAAIHALREIGPEGKDAVPALISVLMEGEQSIRWAAAKALEEIGVASVSALRGMLTKEDLELRVAVIQILKGIEFRVDDRGSALWLNRRGIASY